MNSAMKFTALGLISMLLIAITVPTTTYAAGTLTIYNKNCTRLKGFKKKHEVKVHVFTNEIGCRDIHVTVKKGDYKTIGLKEHGTYEDCGKYHHEATGTTAGKADVHPNETSWVTCLKDAVGLCHCLKD